MKKNIVIVVLSVVALLLAGTVGYFILDKVINKELNENNIVESIDLEYAESIVEEYYKSSYHLGGNIFTKGLSDEIKMLIALNNVPLRNISGIDCSSYYEEVSDDASYYLVPLNTSDKLSGACDASSKGIYYSYVNDVYNNFFGGDMPKKDLVIGTYRFDYIEDSDIYISLSFYGGAADFSMEFYKVKDSQLNNKKLIINVAYSLFTPILSDSFAVPTTYTPDFDSTLKIELEENTNYEELQEEIFEKYLDKMSTYKFTFKVENGKYMLKDVSKVEA